MFATALVLGFAPLIVALAPFAKVAGAAALSYVGWRVERYFKEKQESEKVSRWEKSLERLAKKAIDAVAVTQQTFVDDLVEKSADGKLSESDKRQALSKAADELMRTLEPALEAELREQFGPDKFSAIIVNQIEAAVSRGKWTPRAAMKAAKTAVALEQVTLGLQKGLDAPKKK